MIQFLTSNQILSEKSLESIPPEHIEQIFQEVIRLSNYSKQNHTDSMQTEENTEKEDSGPNISNNKANDDNGIEDSKA